MSTINVIKMKNLGKKIRELRENLKLTQGEFAAAIGVTQKTITFWENDKNEPNEENILTICNKYNIDKDFFITQDVITIDNCLNLPILGGVSASMGTGIEVYDESKTGVYKISAKVLKDIGANPQTSDIIFAEGDSMEPTIQGGSALIVDKSKIDVKDGKIYCIQFNGALMAKRLQLLPPKKLRIISDNFNKYPAWDVDFSKDIDFDFKVIGEVMRWMTNAR